MNILRKDQVSLAPASLDPKIVHFLQDLRNNPLVAHQLINRSCISAEYKIEDWIKHKTRDPLRESLLVINLTSNEEGDDPVGYVTYLIEDQITRVASLGLCVGTQYRGQGIGSKAIELLLNYLSNVLCVSKFTFTSLESNLASRKLFAKFGFEEVGILKRHFLSFGSFHDVIIGEKVPENSLFPENDQP